MKCFIMDEEHNVIETDMFTWRTWMARDENRRVGLTEVWGDVFVSTVMLHGSTPDYVFGKNGVRHFETGQRVRGEYDLLERYATYAEAVVGHQRWCAYHAGHCPLCEAPPPPDPVVCAACGFQFKPLDRWRFIVTPHGVRITVGP